MSFFIGVIVSFSFVCSVLVSLFALGILLQFQ